MDFGAPGTAAGTPRSVAGNTIQRNIFYWHGERTAARSMIGTQVKFTADFLKPNGSDHNLFFSPDEDAATALVFPNKVNLSTWQGKTKSASTGVATWQVHKQLPVACDLWVQFDGLLVIVAPRRPDRLLI